jgi:hypothetical protein
VRNKWFIRQLIPFLFYCDITAAAVIGGGGERMLMNVNNVIRNVNFEKLAFNRFDRYFQVIKRFPFRQQRQSSSAMSFQFATQFMESLKVTGTTEKIFYKDN